MTATTLEQRPSFATIARAGAIGIVVAAVLNAILYFISTAVGWLPIMASMGQPITLAPILIFGVVAGLIGIAVYYALTRMRSQEVTNRWFIIIASIVLIVMAVTPVLQTVDPNAGGVIMLELMHVVAALPLMYTLTKMT